MKKNVVSCGIVGSGDLSVQCADALIKCGHRIAWVMPRGRHLKEWAKMNGVPDYYSLSAIQTAGIQIDYLFSILNDLILKEDFLSLPSQCAINYHNSMLPAYAGVFATSWAILNGETKHGVTWHIMEKRIDSGEIVEQGEIPVGLNDTAYTLNQTCKTRALVLFTSLIGRLTINGRLASYPQAAQGRSYYPLTRKPPGAGLIIWEDPVERLNLHARALTRGDIDNSFELMKFLFRDSFMVVEGASPEDPGLAISGEISTALPGTILGCGEDGMIVATGTAPAIIRRLRYPDGTRIEPPDWMATSALAIGDRLPCPHRNMTAALQKVCEAIAAHETYCARAWSGDGNDAAVIPRFEKDAGTPDELLSDYMDAGLVLLAFLLSVNKQRNECTMLVSSFHARKQCLHLEPFFSTVLPVHFNYDQNEKVHDAEQRLLRRVSGAVRNGLHGKDLLLRKKVVSPAHIPLMVDFGGIAGKDEPGGGGVPDAILLELRPGIADFHIRSPFGDEAALHEMVSDNFNMLCRDRTAFMKAISPDRKAYP